MLIADKDRVKPAPGVGTTSVEGFGANTGKALAGFSGILSKSGFDISSDESTKKAIVDAGQAELEYDEQGNVRPPSTVKEESNLLGPTIYDERYASVLLDRYRNEAKNEGIEEAIKMRQQFKDDPDGFKNAWTSYSKGRVKNSHKLVSAELSKLLNDEGTRHYVGMANQRAKNDWKEAITADTVAMNYKQNKLSQLVRGGADYNSAAVIEAMTDVAAHHSNQIVQGYISEKSTPAFISGLNEMLAEAHIQRALMLNDGTELDGQKANQEILKNIINGELKIPVFAKDEDTGFIRMVGQSKVGDTLGIEGLNRLVSKIKEGALIDAKIGRLDRVIAATTITDGLANYVMLQNIKGNFVTIQDVEKEYAVILKSQGISANLSADKQLSLVLAAFGRQESISTAVALSARPEFIDNAKVILTSLREQLSESQRNSLTTSSADFDAQMDSLESGGALNDKKRLALLNARVSTLRSIVTKKKKTSAADLDMMRKMEIYNRNVNFRMREYEKLNKQPTDKSSDEYKAWLGGRAEHVKRNVPSIKFTQNASSAAKVEELGLLGISSQGLLEEGEIFSWSTSQSPEAFRVMIKTAENYGVIPSGAIDFLTTSAGSFGRMSEESQIHALAVYQELKNSDKLSRVIDAIGMDTAIFFNRMSQSSGQKFIGAENQGAIDINVIERNAKVLSGDLDPVKRFDQLSKKDIDYFMLNSPGLITSDVDNVNREFQAQLASAFAENVSQRRGAFGQFNADENGIALKAAMSSLLEKENAKGTVLPYVITRYGLANATFQSSPRVIAELARQHINLFEPFGAPDKDGDAIKDANNNTFSLIAFPTLPIIYAVKQITSFYAGDLTYIAEKSDAPEFYYGEAFNSILSEAISPLLEKMEKAGQLDSPVLGINVFLRTAGYSKFKGPNGEPLPKWELLTVTASGKLLPLNTGKAVYDEEINMPYLKHLKETEVNVIEEAMEAAQDAYDKTKRQFN